MGEAGSWMARLTDFLEMGGYAVFVWPAFGLAAVVMVGLLIATLRQLRRRRRELAELEASLPSHRRTQP